MAYICVRNGFINGSHMFLWSHDRKNPIVLWSIYSKKRRKKSELEGNGTQRDRHHSVDGCPGNITIYTRKHVMHLEKKYD